MIYLVIISALILVLLVILISPVHVYIDTESNTYKVYQGGWLSAGFIFDEEEIILLELRLIGIKVKPISILDKVFDKKKKRSKENKKKRVVSERFGIGVFYKIIRSCEVKAFYLNMDTGDPVQNAKLYPIFELLNYKYGGFHINFTGRNRLLLDVQSRPIRILKIFVTQ